LLPVPAATVRLIYSVRRGMVQSNCFQGFQRNRLRIWCDISPTGFGDFVFTGGINVSAITGFRAGFEGFYLVALPYLF
jgi:hypothetical protein